MTQISLIDSVETCAAWLLVGFVCALLAITVNLRPPGPPGVPSDEADPS